MTDQPRKRVTIDAPDGTTVFAARHLDATEGRVQVGATVDTATRSAITRVLDYVSKAHNSPAVPALSPSSAPAASAHPIVQGRCPACRGASLFLGSGGHVTCARLDCPNPTAADELLCDAHGRLEISNRALNNAALEAVERAEQAEAELALLREGEETIAGHDPAVEHTNGQWLYRFNRTTPAERLRIIGELRGAAARGHDCFLMGHQQRLDEDRHAWVALARVRDVIADMADITGARHWARILRTAVDGEPEAPAGAPRCDHCGEPVTRATVREWVGPASKGLGRVWHPLCHDIVLTTRAVPVEGDLVPAREATSHADDDPPVQCWHTEPGSPCDWNICRQPERGAGDGYRVGAALREALAAFRAVRDDGTRTVVGYLSAPVHPDDMNRWRASLDPPKEP